ncbi:MAG: hypothetical protein D6741_13905 [Planctomycetota bacterium]|nr:MAG: hypothetical protein D6741_13905 [Planctomycetota bacterium]
MPDSVGPIENPFVARLVRPGAIAYLPPPDVDLEHLIDRFFALQCRGSIVGPHGTGKSAFTAEFARRLTERRKEVVFVELHQAANRLPDRTFARAVPGAVMVVDGYEQLSVVVRRSLRAWTRLRGCGLFVTCHRPLGLPVLYRTRPDREQARRIVAHLQQSHEAPSLIEPADVDAAFDRHEGNLREIMFDLYDLYEIRRDRIAQNSPD